MKTLLITFDYPPMVSGIGTFFGSVWKLLSQDDHSILAPRFKDSQTFDKENNLNIYRYFTFWGLKPLRIISLIILTGILIIKKKIKVLVCGVPFSIGFIGFIYKRIFKIPYCIFYYGGEFDKYKKKKIKFKVLRKIINNADCIIANSRFSANEAQEFGAEKGKIFVVTPGVDIKRFRPGIDCTQLKNDLGIMNKRVLLTISRLVKRKGIDIVIEALPKIKHAVPDLVYVIVGAGEEENNLKALAKEKGVENDVIFVGRVSEKELPCYYNACNVFVMPNRQTEGEEIVEGFGISFIEASACYKPVVGGKSGGSEDAVKDGVTGVLVDPNNQNMVVETLINLLKNEQYARKLAEAGRNMVEKEFTWEARATQLTEVLGLIK